MYIMSAVMELRRLRIMDVKSAQRMIDLARNRRKELSLILGNKDERRGIAERNKSYTGSTKTVAEGFHYAQIGEYIIEKVILRVLMGWGRIRRIWRETRVVRFPKRVHQ